jgi:hypothetical protein
MVTRSSLPAIEEPEASGRREIPRMVETKESSRNEDPSTGKRPSSKASASEETEQLVLTLNPAKGEVLKVERIDRNGHRRELSEDEIGGLAGKDDADDLEAALEEAYGGGILDVLGEGDEDEDEEEIALRRLLVARLLGRQVVRRRLRRLVIGRALRRRFVETRGRR